MYFSHLQHLAPEPGPQLKFKLPYNEISAGLWAWDHFFKIEIQKQIRSRDIKEDTT